MLTGYKIKMLRMFNGKTQKEVADFCNVTERYIQMIEAEQERPSQETYGAIIDCINGVGKPLPKIARCNTKKARESKE